MKRNEEGFSRKAEKPFCFVKKKEIYSIEREREREMYIYIMCVECWHEKKLSINSREKIVERKWSKSLKLYKPILERFWSTDLLCNW